MNEFVMFAAAAPGGDNLLTSTARTFGFNMPLFISQVISFVIVAVLLRKFAYQPILKVLLERRERIESGLKNAEKIKAELARTEAQRQEILAKANTDANRLIEEARAAAAKVQEQETQRAISMAEGIIAKAREAAEADRARMLTELRREVGQLVVKTTAQVTGKVLTMDDQRRLAEETNKQLAA
jgi:F-type H+-transporting ATPase subunit b